MAVGFWLLGVGCWLLVFGLYVWFFYFCRINNCAMDAKITLSFDKETIKKAKEFAESQQISLSRLTEYLYRQITSGTYKSLDELPIADWVLQLSEGKPVYLKKPRTRKSSKKDFFEAKK